MPELPEVEAARRLLLRHCQGARVRSVEALADDIVLDGCAAGEVEVALRGAALLDVHRKGKHLWFELDRRPWPCFHFGMTGSFSVQGEEGVAYKSFKVDTSEWPPRFYKLEIEFDNGRRVAFTDSRRFGRIRLREEPTTSAPISDLGFDPLVNMPPTEDFRALVQQRTAPIKAVLLDQSVAAGVGNWVADEVLYQARVHPKSKANDLSAEQMELIRVQLQAVVQLAVNANANSTEFPDTWLFHHRWGKVPGSVDGQRIEFMTVGGRTTAVVPAVQKLSSGGKKAVARTKEASSSSKKTPPARVGTETKGKAKRSGTQLETASVKTAKKAAPNTSRSTSRAPARTTRTLRPPRGALGL